MRPARALVVLAALLGGWSGAARAQGESSAWREVQLDLRDAVRDTSGHGDDPARLLALGRALCRAGRSHEARGAFARAAGGGGADHAEAMLMLARLDLFAGRLDSAAARLPGAGDGDDAAKVRYALALRRNDWAGAAALARAAGDDGRLPLLEALSEGPAWELQPGPERGVVLFERTRPVPLVEVLLNGRQVRMALDPGLEDILVDPSAFRVCRLRAVSGQRTVMWNGSRVAVGNAIAPTLELAGMRFAGVPAGIHKLGKYSLAVAPGERAIAGVIGLRALRAFTPSIDWKRARLELVRGPGTIPAGGTRVPFELWGDHEMMVQGSVAGSRRVWLQVGAGLPGAGLGATRELLEEIGVKASVLARAVKGAGHFLQGSAWAQANVSTVTIGPLASDRMHAWVGAFDGAEVLRHGVRREAVLGPEFFDDRRVTIDWAAQELVFEAD